MTDINPLHNVSRLEGREYWGCCVRLYILTEMKGRW
jgi:hypothetical protein